VFFFEPSFVNFPLVPVFLCDDNLNRKVCSSSIGKIPLLVIEFTRYFLEEDLVVQQEADDDDRESEEKTFLLSRAILFFVLTAILDVKSRYVIKTH
jgi:hypothetical protein